MKNSIIYCLLLAAHCTLAQDLKYYLPDSVTYNPAIPKPKDIIYHEVGEWHVTHDRLVNYMKAVAAAAPDRVKLETMGFTYENRPQVLLIITSPKNHQRLEEIRQQHVQLTDPSKSASLNIDNMPIVVWIGHSIHGNEPSGANASFAKLHIIWQQHRENKLMNCWIMLLFFLILLLILMDCNDFLHGPTSIRVKI